MKEKKSVEEAMAASLKELLGTKPLDKITIQELADGAGVIRATFYNHFRDKYDLVQWILRTELFDPARPLLEIGLYRESVILIFRNIEKDKDFYSRLAAHVSEDLRQIVKRELYLLLYDFFETEATGKRAHAEFLDPQYLASYYANSVEFVIMEWMRLGMPCPPEEMAEIYDYIATRSLTEVLKELRS